MNLHRVKELKYEYILYCLKCDLKYATMDIQQGDIYPPCPSCEGKLFRHSERLLQVILDLDVKMPGETK